MHSPGPREQSLFALAAYLTLASCHRRIARLTVHGLSPTAPCTCLACLFLLAITCMPLSHTRPAPTDNPLPRTCLLAWSPNDLPALATVDQLMLDHPLAPDDLPREACSYARLGVSLCQVTAPIFFPASLLGSWLLAPCCTFSFLLHAYSLGILGAPFTGPDCRHIIPTVTSPITELVLEHSCPAGPRACLTCCIFSTHANMAQNFNTLP